MSLKFLSSCFPVTQYILSSGKDSLVKLWEIATSRTLITYTGAGSDQQKNRTQAVFNHTEDYGKVLDNTVQPHYTGWPIKKRNQHTSHNVWMQ